MDICGGYQRVALDSEIVLRGLNRPSLKHYFPEPLTQNVSVLAFLYLAVNELLIQA